MFTDAHRKYKTILYQYKLFVKYVKHSKIQMPISFINSEKYYNNLLSRVLYLTLCRLDLERFGSDNMCGKKSCTRI